MQIITSIVRSIAPKNNITSKIDHWFLLEAPKTSLIKRNKKRLIKQIKYTDTEVSKEIYLNVTKNGTLSVSHRRHPF